MMPHPLMYNGLLPLQELFRSLGETGKDLTVAQVNKVTTMIYAELPCWPCLPAQRRKR